MTMAFTESSTSRRAKTLARSCRMSWVIALSLAGLLSETVAIPPEPASASMKPLISSASYIKGRHEMRIRAARFTFQHDSLQSDLSATELGTNGAVDEYENTAAGLRDELVIAGEHDDRTAGRGEPGDDFSHLHARVRIDSLGWLVQQQHPGLAGHCSR